MSYVIKTFLLVNNYCVFKANKEKKHTIKNFVKFLNYKQSTLKTITVIKIKKNQRRLSYTDKLSFREIVKLLLLATRPRAEYTSLDTIWMTIKMTFIVDYLNSRLL